MLYGPAGTGKTTFAESLAYTCEVPMVEITPSDIVVKGQENIERRARVVMKALSLLTRTVILFDEFDPVIWKREPVGSGKTTVFTFLTPGMLPKLKDLNQSAKRRSVAYILNTNLVGGLDAAAIRGGRFDERVGIYPPDVLSRLGRFCNEVQKWPSAEKDSIAREIYHGRLKTVLEKTSGGGMQTLKNKGWFKAPDDNTEISKLLGKPFGYVFGGDPRADFNDARKEDNIREVRSDFNEEALREHLEWQWVIDWDIKLAKDGTLADALKPSPCVKPPKLKG